MPKADPNKADKQSLRAVGRKAARAQLKAERDRKERDRTIRRIAAKGKLSGREIGKAVGLSHTAVQTILDAGD
jgi:hypothetical protein